MPTTYLLFPELVFAVVASLPLPLKVLLHTAQCCNVNGMLVCEKLLSTQANNFRFLPQTTLAFIAKRANDNEDRQAARMDKINI